MTTLIDYARMAIDQDGRPATLVRSGPDDISYGDPKVENPTGQIIATVDELRRARSRSASTR